jgi:hypothetical protein
MSTLSTNQIVVEYIIKEGDVKKAKDGFDKLTQAEKDAITNAQKLNDELQKTGKEGKNSTDKVAGGLNNVGGMASKLGPLMAGAFSVASVMAFGKQVFNVTAEFQKLSAVLKNTLGSGAAASVALENIKEFAKTTPFAVSELTESFVKLANQGFTPTIDQMRKLGDLASSTGKSFDQLAEAIIDAQVGEFERLKEFGVRAQKAGDQVIFTFKGVETQVQNNNAAIREYLVGLGDYNGVAGAAAAVSDTLGGKVNNLGDAWDSFLNKIGTLLGPILTEALNTTSQFMDDINRIFAGGKTSSELYASVELESYKYFNDMVLNYTDEELDKFLKSRQAKLKTAQDELKKAQQKVKEGTTGFFGEVQSNPQAVKDVKQLNIEIANYNGEIAATTEQIKKRGDATTKTEAIYSAYVAKQKALEDAKQKAKEKADKEAKANAEKMAKMNQEKYNAEVDQLELEKQITAEKIKQTVGADGQKIAIMELEFATNVKLLKISENSAKLGVQQAKDKAKLLPEILKTQNQEITQEYIDAGIRDRETRVKGEDEVQQGIYEAKLKAIERNKMIQEASIESEVLTDSQRKEKLILNEIAANDEIIKSNDEAANNGVESALDANAKILADNAKLYKELKDLRKKDEEDQKKKDVERVQAASQVASAVLDGFMNLMQQQTQNELTALNKRYDAELRLAGDNEQKVMEINEKRKQEEKELRTKEFEAQRAAAIAQVVFKTAPIIAEYFVSGFLAPLAIAGLATAAAQIAFIAAQPVPEFKEGTKGKPFKGGKAIVGEIGKEWVVTTSGQVYETPGVATLVDLPKGSQVIPHHEVIKSERFMGSKLMNQGRGESGNGHIVSELISIKETLSKLPITSLTMDERGFTKKIQTKSRETRILNNRFGN